MIQAIKTFVPYIPASGSAVERMNVGHIQSALKNMAYREIKPEEATKEGFVSPDDQDQTDDLVQQVDPQGRLLLMSYRYDSKKITPAALRKESRKVAESMGKKYSPKMPSKERKPIEEVAIRNLIPTAQVDSKTVSILYDNREGTLLVEASTIKTADDLFKMWMKALTKVDHLPQLQPVRPQPEAMVAMFTKWLDQKRAEQPFSLGEYVHLIDDEAEDKPAAKLEHHDLTAEEVERHLQSGKGVKEIALRYGNDLSFVLTKEVVFKKVAPTKNFQSMLKSKKDKEEGRGDAGAEAFAIFNKCLMALTDMREVIEKCKA